MKILFKVFILVLFFFTPIYAQSTNQIDQISKTVVFMRQQTQKTILIDGKPAELYYRYPGTEEYKPIMETLMGSGFIIKYKGRDYLVTAKHIAESFSAGGEIVINLPDNKSTVITFQALSQASVLRGAHWFHHPKADLSIHPMGYPAGGVDASGIPENFYPKADIDVMPLNPVYVVGFPLGLGVLDKLSPIAKEAKIASRLTSIDDPSIPRDLHFYLLDQALSQGYSGSPVFYAEDIKSSLRVAGEPPAKVGEKLHLIGVQSMALSDKTGGKISLVVPISYIWDILDSHDFQAYLKSLDSKKK